MSETIRVEVPTAPSALPTLRMIVGGVVARLELSLDDLEDLYLALGELVRAVPACGSDARFTLVIDIGESELTLTAGPFCSPDLLERLQPREEDAACLDLCQLLSSVVQSFTVIGGPEAFSVVMIKRRG